MKPSLLAKKGIKSVFGSWAKVCNGLKRSEVNRKAVTYHNWRGKPLNKTAHTPFCIPSYLFKDLDEGAMRNVSRFRLRAHCLKVES
eukprot:592834-Pelagomonas_calceolata.AAC.1